MAEKTHECPKCHKPIESGLTDCPHCGEKIGPRPRPAAPQPGEPRLAHRWAKQAYSGGSKGAGCTMIFIAVANFFYAFIVYLAWQKGFIENDSIASGIIAGQIIFGAIYIACFISFKKHPLGSAATAFIIFTIVLAINLILAPEGLLNPIGIIVLAVMFGSLLNALRSAVVFNRFKREETLKAIRAKRRKLPDRDKQK